VTPPDLQYMIDDFFDSSTLYDNRAQSATAKALPDGCYEVTITVVAKKRKADELGKENDAPLHDMIDIGVLDAADEPLFLEKRSDRARGDRVHGGRREAAGTGRHRSLQQVDRPPAQGQPGGGGDRVSRRARTLGVATVDLASVRAFPWQA